MSGWKAFPNNSPISPISASGSAACDIKTSTETKYKNIEATLNMDITWHWELVCMKIESFVGISPKV